MKFDLSSSGVLLVTFLRADKLNALDAEFHRELSTVFADIGMDRRVRAVVLTGSGRAFCAGGDLDWIAGETPETRETTFFEAKKIVDDLLNVPQPVIAAVMRSAVIERSQIVGKTASNQIQINAPVMQITVSRNHFRHRIRMQIDRLYGDQRTQPISVLNDDLRYQPGVSNRIVGVNEYAFAAGLFAPAGDIGDPLQVQVFVHIFRLRASRKYFKRSPSSSFLSTGDVGIGVHLSPVPSKPQNSQQPMLSTDGDDTRVV